jgi:hypothetical protein
LQSSTLWLDSEGGRYAKFLIVGVGVGVGVTTGVGVGVGSTGLKTGFGLGFAAALTATPLFHTSLVPDLTQVNFFPEAVAVAPALVHLAPALTAALEGAVIRERERITDRRIKNFVRMK